MRRILVVVAVVVLAGAAGATGWHFLHPHDKLADARQLLRQGNVRGAQLVLRSVVQEHPENAEAHLMLGQVQLRMGDPIAAERELLAAREHGGDEHATRPLLAQALVAQNRDADVLRDYAADGLAPEQAVPLLLARAEAQVASKQPEAAAASVAQAQRLQPRSVEAALAAARVALVRGDVKGGQARIADALAIDPASLPALMLQGEVRAATNDRKGALESYDAALKAASAAGAEATGSGLDPIRLARAGVLVGGDPSDLPKARADLDAVLKDQPRNPLGNFLLAEVLARNVDWKAADAALTAVGPALTRMPRADALVAVVKANVGEPEQAVAAAERQVARNPADLAAAKLLARLDLGQSRPAAAADTLAAAVAALRKLGGQPDAETLDMMGEGYAGAGRPQQALTALQQASALAPEDTRLLTRMAALQMRQGDPTQASATLKRALDLEPVADKTVPDKTPAATPPTSPSASSSASPPAPPPAALQGPTPIQTAAALVAASLQAGEIDRATAALDRLHQSQGQPGYDAGQAAMLSGMVRLAQMDIAGARTEFEAAAAADPAALPPRINLARIAALQGRQADAAKQLDDVLGHDPANVAALTAAVNLRLTMNQPAEAVRAAEAAHQAAPTDPGLIVGLADLYSRTGAPAKATALLDPALHDAADAAKDGQSSKAGNAAAVPGLLAAKVRAQVAAKQIHEAAATARLLLERAPDNSGLRRQAAELLATDHDVDGARALLRDGLAAHPGDPVLLAGEVALASREGGPDAGVARAAELARDPANPAARSLQGDALMAARKFPEAAAAYETALGTLAKDAPEAAAPSLVQRQAQAWSAAGDTARATGLLRDFLAAHKDDQVAASAIALVLSSYDIAANRLDDARTHLEAALAGQPNNPAALNNLAWVAQQQGDLARARTLASRAYLLSPTPQSADTLGWVVLAQGRVPEAMALLREAAGGLPGDPAILYHLASAQARDGQRDAARSTLKTVLASTAPFDEKPAAVKLQHELETP